NISSFSNRMGTGAGTSPKFENDPLGPYHNLLMMCGFIIGIGVIIYIWMIARKTIKDIEENEERDEHYVLEDGLSNCNENVQEAATKGIRYRYSIFDESDELDACDDYNGDGDKCETEDVKQAMSLNKKQPNQNVNDEEAFTIYQTI
ncbi:5134_t:CDS:1, partial [Acaulospora colombiana]